MSCPQCKTDDLSSHRPDCGYHPDNFQTGEQQIIEGLSARVTELREAMKPFAELARGFDYFSASDKLNLAAGLTVADLRKLRDAYDGADT